MPINQGGSFEDSYVNKAAINEAFGFSERYAAIVLNDSRLSLSDSGMLNFIYNLPLSHISRIEYTPSMEAFKFQTGASSGVLHIRDKSKTESSHSKGDNRDDKSNFCDDRENENVDGVHDTAYSVDVHQNSKVCQVIAATHCVRFVALDCAAARR